MSDIPVFKIGDKALWRNKIPVVIVDGYEGIPHKRTVKMDVEGDVFEWDVRISELSSIETSILSEKWEDSLTQELKWYANAMSNHVVYSPEGFKAHKNLSRHIVKFIRESFGAQTSVDTESDAS